MSPAGSFESLRAAIKAKTDAVYFGVGNLNMRANSANFRLKDLKKIVSICKKNNVKTYLTINIVMYNEDLKLMKKICDKAKKAGINAVIASDMAVINYANSIGLNVNCSTQMNISNIEAVKFYSKFADIMVLARELNLEQIKKICSEIKKQNIRGPNDELVKIEVFIHGALCVSISGRCYMSLTNYNSSANRGQCLQNCRRSYRVIDEQTGKELVLDNKYVMSPKDLCTVSFLDRIIDSGASILKIEGRGRPPEYVYTTTKVYKEALESCNKKIFTKEKIEKWTEELRSVFNRGFWQGNYYLGEKVDGWSNYSGNKSTKEKHFLGLVKNYFVKSKIGEIIVQSENLMIGDEIIIIGPTTGVVKTNVKSIVKSEKNITSAEKGDFVTIPIPERVRKKDKVYLIKERK
ncbi:U32 family peptidase [Candidatus Woesearchaeota archaeon]|nr:U32 family peptidase [Candidatus Woesearchaeota archaeon]